jgi:hypothetical protein
VATVQASGDSKTECTSGCAAASAVAVRKVLPEASATDGFRLAAAAGEVRQMCRRSTSRQSARVLSVCSCSQLCIAAEAYLTATMVQTVKMVGASSAEGSMLITSDVTGWLGFSSHHLQR